MNLLVREREETVLEIIELGERLREAQASSDGAAIRYLDVVRRQLMDRTELSEAVELAEHHDLTLSRPAKEGIEGTLWAMMSNPTVAEAVQNGRVQLGHRSLGIPADICDISPPWPGDASSPVPLTEPRFVNAGTAARSGDRLTCGAYDPDSRIFDDAG